MGKALSYLAHAFGSVLVGAEHVALGHDKPDFCTILADQFINQSICFRTECLPNGVKENKHDVAVFSEPLVDSVNIELILQVAISKTRGINKDYILEVSLLAWDCLY